MKVPCPACRHRTHYPGCTPCSRCEGEGELEVVDAAGWTVTHGGTHRCERCGFFGDASRVAPFWRFFASSTTCTRTVCNECAADEFELCDHPAGLRVFDYENDEERCACGHVCGYGLIPLSGRPL